MEKKTNFFGFDRTPRKALWRTIEEQSKIIKSLESERNNGVWGNKELVRGLEITLEAAKNSLAAVERKVAEKDKEIANLRSQLDRNARAKDKRGRFIKHK